MATKKKTSSPITDTQQPLSLELRVLVQEGEPWFVGEDAATILGFTHPRNALAVYVDEADKDCMHLDIDGKLQQLLLIDECGLLTLTSNAAPASAYAFQKWFGDVVAPYLNQKRCYSSSQEEALQPEDEERLHNGLYIFYYYRTRAEEHDAPEEDVPDYPTTVDANDEHTGAMTYEPGRSYRGSARIDELGNILFRPFSQASEDSNSMRKFKDGFVDIDGIWSIFRSRRTLKITLTVYNYPKLSMASLKEKILALCNLANNNLPRKTDI